MFVIRQEWSSLTEIAEYRPPYVGSDVYAGRMDHASMPENDISCAADKLIRGYFSNGFPQVLHVVRLW